MAELDRLFDMLQAQNKTLIEQGSTLAAIKASQDSTHERLFDSPDSLSAKIEKTDIVVARHSRQISFWRGGLAALAFLWAAAIAVAAVVSKRP